MAMNKSLRDNSDDDHDDDDGNVDDDDDDDDDDGHDFSPQCHLSVFFCFFLFPLSLHSLP